MEVTVISLSVACLILSVVTGILAGSVPWLWWHCWKLEQKVETLDEVLAGVLEASGLKKNS